MKYRILLETYFLPSALEAQIADFVAYYNTRRYYENFGNVTPEPVYFGRAHAILNRRQIIKSEAIERRRRFHRTAAV